MKVKPRPSAGERVTKTIFHLVTFRNSVTDFIGLERMFPQGGKEILSKLRSYYSCMGC